MNKKIIAPFLFILVLIWVFASSFWAYWTWEILTPFSSAWWVINALGQVFFYIGVALFLHALFKKYADPHLTLFRSIVIFTLIIFWSLFAAIWGFWKVGGVAYEIFGPAWWFDEVGHALFGAILTVSLLILHQTYSAIYPPLLRALGEGHLMRDIVGEVALGAVLWEAAELLHDLYVQISYSAWIARAQLNSVDTTLDIISAVLFAFLTLLAYEAAKKIYHRLRSGESKEETVDAIKILEYFTKRAHIRSRHELKKLISFLNNSFKE